MTEQTVNVLIIGAGISGLAIGLSCAASKRSAIIVDRGEICGGASSNSLRIIHGGFRYLQSLNIARVIRSRRDQARLQRRYGEYLMPLRCRMPLERTGLKSAPVLRAGLGVYGALSGLTGSGFSVGGRVLDPLAVRRDTPLLADCAPHGAFEWRDVMVRDIEQFHAALAEEIRGAGGEIRIATDAHAVRRVDGGFEVQLRTSAGEAQIRARNVVNAAGAWLERARPPEERGPDVWWCRAFNLEFPRAVSAGFGLAAQSAAGRLFFIVPRGEGSALGTAYSAAQTDVPLSAAPSEDEIAAFIAEANQAFPSLRLQRAEVSRIDSGALPCRAGGGREPELIGASQVIANDGYIEVLSTKYTTCLSQADEVMKRLR